MAKHWDNNHTAYIERGKTIIHKTQINGILILAIPILDEEKKLRSIFIFILLCGASKGFMKALKAFIKPFEAPQRSVKIKINLIFISIQLSEMHGTLSITDYVNRYKSEFMKIWGEFQKKPSQVIITVKNTIISPNFLVWKFCGKAQFPHCFGRIIIFSYCHKTLWQ